MKTDEAIEKCLSWRRVLAKIEGTEWNEELEKQKLVEQSLKLLFNMEAQN